MTGYRWIWVGWIGTFLVLEFTALIRGRSKDTLSDFVWWLCKVTPGRTDWSWTFVHLVVAFFLVWLFFHLAFGFFR